MKKIKGLTLLALLILFVVSCELPNNSQSSSVVQYNGANPTLANITVSSVNSYSAIVSCNVLNEGSTTTTEKGICYGIEDTPLAYDSNYTVRPVVANYMTIRAGAGTGSFTVTITGLTRGLKYYVRAYAENTTGFSYSNIQSFYPNFIIGENYEGGILFYLDNTLQHGYIAAPSDQGTNTAWGCAGDTVKGAEQLAIGTGPQNTIDIVNVCPTGTAAGLCKGLILGGFSDWFLPSYDELELLYKQKVAVGGFANGYYWSSSEYDANNAYYQNFVSGDQVYNTKNTQANVRAIRAF